MGSIGIHGARRLAAALCWLALGAACGGKDEDAGYSIVVLTLDTTRPEALSSYTGAAGTTPSLDALAADGIAFDRAFSPVPLTLPAHATLFTGLLPPRHGVRRNGQSPLSSEATTLAELAREKGYQTAAFVGAVVLDPAFGLDQGFELYDVPEGRRQAAAGIDMHEKEVERPAREVADLALAWLARRDAQRPFFLWCHFYDPHAPYAPPAELAASPDPSAQTLPALPPEYVGEVRAVDVEIGRILDALRSDGTLARTIVVAAGDHGESFGEHGEQGHGILCHNDTLRVPLILRLPERWNGERRAGERAAAVASLADVFPTLVRALGWTAGEVDGLDLMGAIPADRGIYFESYSGYLSYGWSPLAGWLDAKGKYVHGSQPAFYDWPADPGETAPLERTEAELAPYVRGIALVAARPGLASSGQVDEDLLANLRGLGYAEVGGTSSALPGPLDATGLPSPESMLALHDEALRGCALAQRGELAEAEAIFRRVLEQNPKNPFVLEQLALCLLQTDRLQEAADTLGRFLRETPGEHPRVWFRLGSVLRSLGEHEEAVQALRQADALAPDHATYLRELYSALRDAGREREANAVAKRLSALQKDPARTRE